jgi:hypothetical protein
VKEKYLKGRAVKTYEPDSIIFAKHVRVLMVSGTNKNQQKLMKILYFRKFILILRFITS